MLKPQVLEKSIRNCTEAWLLQNQHNIIVFRDFERAPAAVLHSLQAQLRSLKNRKTGPSWTTQDVVESNQVLQDFLWSSSRLYRYMLPRKELDVLRVLPKRTHFIN